MMDDRETARLMLAAAALQGMTSCISAFVETPEDIKQWTDVTPREAVFLADATLAELSKTPPPARTKEPPRPPDDPGESEAGEPERGCVVPRGDGLAMTRGTAGFDLAPDSTSQPATAGANPASPVSVWDCEARFEHDPVCPGPAVFDPVSKGRFCGLHAQIPEGHRREMHRLHGHRNRPLAPVAKVA